MPANDPRLGPILTVYQNHLNGSRRLSAATVKSYVARVTTYLAWLSKQYPDADSAFPPAATAAEDINRWYHRSLTSPSSEHTRPADATIRLTVAAVSDFYRRELQVTVPREVDVAPRLPASRTVRYLNATEIERWDQAVKTLNSPRDAAAVATIRYAGLKRSEVVALNVTHCQIVPKPGVLLVPGGPGRRPRRIVMSAALRFHLQLWNYNRPGFINDESVPALFLNKTGNRIGERSINNIVSAIATRAGLTNVTPQALRHTFAMELLHVQEIDLPTIAQLLGISTSDARKHYGEESNGSI